MRQKQDSGKSTNAPNRHGAAGAWNRGDVVNIWLRTVSKFKAIPYDSGEIGRG